MIAAWVALAIALALAVTVAVFFGARRVFLALPRPSTFAEGQRLLYGWLAAAAGMFCGAMAIAMIALLMFGGWSKSEEHTIVVIFGCALAGFIAAMSAVMVGLLVGGPVGRFKGSAGRDGVSLEAAADAEEPQP